MRGTAQMTWTWQSACKTCISTMRQTAAFKANLYPEKQYIYQFFETSQNKELGKKLHPGNP